MATRVTLNQAVINRELLGRSGANGRIIAGFAGLATKEVKAEMRSRAGGEWWHVSSTIRGGGGSDMVLTVSVDATRPHVITPRRENGVLVFDIGGRTIFTRRVRHPGSSAPIHLVEDALRRAGQRFPQIAASGAAGA